MSLPALAAKIESGVCQRSPVPLTLGKPQFHLAGGDDVEELLALTATNNHLSLTETHILAGITQESDCGGAEEH